MSRDESSITPEQLADLVAQLPQLQSDVEGWWVSSFRLGVYLAIDAEGFGESEAAIYQSTDGESYEAARFHVDHMAPVAARLMAAAPALVAAAMECIQFRAERSKRRFPPLPSRETAPCAIKETLMRQSDAMAALADAERKDVSALPPPDAPPILERQIKADAVHDGTIEAAITLRAERDELTLHLRAILAIIDKTGGFMSPVNQEAIRAARKAVTG
jgi:hypothetical protein